MKIPPADYDNPWKEAIEQYLERFLDFFFPSIHQAIDWSEPYISLEQELQQIAAAANVEKRVADKFFQVKLLNGDRTRIIIHAEVQSQYESDFPERIFIYNYRAYERYRKPVISLAILGDDRPSWRPDSYGYGLDGFSVEIKFPIAKLLDYQPRQEELEASNNPFALIVMAHLQTQATTGKALERKQSKSRLMRDLLSKGYSREEVVNLFRFIDRMMTLPRKLQQELKADIKRYQEERQMPFLSQFEEMAKEEGIQEGIQEGRQQGTLETRRADLIEILQIRFGSVPPEVVETINRMEDIAQLQQLFRQAIAIPSIAEFQQLLQRSQGES